MSSLDIFGTPVAISLVRPVPLKYEKLGSTVVSDWMMAVLKTTATLKLPPTIASRFFYLCSVCMYDAFRVVYSAWPLVDMMKDLESFSYSLQPVDHDMWIELALHDALIEIFSHLKYPLKELENISRQHASIYRKIYKVIYSPNIADIRHDWRKRVRAYLVKRADDHSKIASVFAPPTEFPNPNSTISTDMDVALTQDLNTLENPSQWCRLDVASTPIQRTVQKYLTPQWGDVKGTLPKTAQDRLLNLIRTHYYPSSETHDQEILDVLEKCQNLTKKDKVSAEFWAGGPGTCTPPGFWMYFARCCSRTKNIDLAQEVLLYYRMATSLFEVGILAWKLKRTYLQERPIQAIRKIRPEMDVQLYDGRTVSNKQWLPYQESNFVTPPFPDFVSGHSSFSSIGARVLTDFFKTNIIPTSQQLTTEHMYLLSPMLRTMDPTCDLCSIHVYPKKSSIQPSFPDTGILMSWVTWDEMAEDAGKSRIYGGIHYESSNQGGLALGRNLYNLLFPSST